MATRARSIGTLRPAVEDAGVDLALFTTLLLGGLSAAAGGIHGAAFPDHAKEHWSFGAFFAVSALFQLGWGFFAVYQPRPAARLLRWGFFANAAFVVLWAMTRTVGVPIGPDPWMAEPIGLVDSITVAFELGLVVMCWRLLRPRAFEGLRERPVSALAWAFAAGASVLAIVGLVSARRPDHMQALTIGNHAKHLLLTAAAFTAAYAIALLRKARSAA